MRVFQAIADRDPVQAQQEMSTLINLALKDTPVPQRSKDRRAHSRPV
jgi:DNA-binding FadR family transcriptional regulator